MFGERYWNLPGCKSVILYLHGPEAWYESTMNTIYFTEVMWQFKLLKLFTPLRRKMGNMSSKLIWQKSHRGTMKNKSAAIAYYHDHIEEVKAAVPAEKLFIFTVDEGWAPLSTFLGVPIPKTDFPTVSDRAEVKKEIGNLTKGAYIIVGLSAVAIFGIRYGFIKLLT